MARPARHSFDLAALYILHGDVLLPRQCLDFGDGARMVAFSEQHAVDAASRPQGLRHRIAADEHIVWERGGHCLRALLLPCCLTAALMYGWTALAGRAPRVPSAGARCCGQPDCRVFCLFSCLAYYPQPSRSLIISLNLPQVIAPSGQRPVFTQLAPAL